MEVLGDTMRDLRPRDDGALGPLRQCRVAWVGRCSNTLGHGHAVGIRLAWASVVVQVHSWVRIVWDTIDVSGRA